MDESKRSGPDKILIFTRIFRIYLRRRFFNEKYIFIK